MGLLDVLTGMQNGPRGQRQPAPSGGSSGSGGSGMSPMTMALIGLLAYKAMQHLGRSSPAAPTRTPTPAPAPTPTQTADSGGLGDILGGLFGGQSGGRGGGLAQGGLGGLLNNPAAGSILSGGLASVIKGLQNSGQSKIAQSWISSGENEDIEPGDLAKALGNDAIGALVKQTGMSREELLEGLSQQLPQLVDHLTPNGRLPTDAEAARMV